MKITQNEYQNLVKDKSPNSPILKDCLLAFVSGGFICTIGQLVLNFFRSKGLGMLDAASATSITMIIIGAVLTGLCVYDKIAKYCGAGTIIPITGFANAIVSPAMEFKSEGIVLGMASKIFVIAGPVLVFGISASIVYGLILVLFNLV